MSKTETRLWIMGLVVFTYAGASDHARRYPGTVRTVADVVWSTVNFAVIFLVVVGLLLLLSRWRTRHRERP